MGPELSLAVVGVVLVGPGVATAFRDFGNYLVKRIETIKNAPELITELQTVAREVCGGRLEACIEIAEHAFELGSLNEALRGDLVRGLETMRQELINIDILLGKLIDQDGKLNKMKLVLPPLWTWRTDAKRCIRRFGKAQSGFQLTINLVEARQRSLAPLTPLSANQYQPIQKSDGSFYTPLEPGSHIFQGQAEIRDKEGKPSSISVIVEFAAKHDVDIPEVTRHLKKNQQEFGILECLGYHKTEIAQFANNQAQKAYPVFKLPTNLDSPTTLRQTMLRTPISLQSPGGGHTLESRYRLAHLISESILFVHTAEFVHKNIRPDTILLLRPRSPTVQTPTESLVNAKPYLTYWTMLRHSSILSSRQGDYMFKRNIYRHPHRQGLQPQARYNIGHDIYSLGVCLLEIGLWEPLITPNDGTDALLVDVNDSYDVSEETMSDTYRTMAIRLGLVEAAESESIEALTKPPTVAKVLIALAKETLPERLGTEYAEIVVACLTCLDGGFGDEAKRDDFEQHKTSVALRFKNLVVEPLAQMY